MKDSNKPRFEEEWRSAFEEAELPPNNDVWTRLDAHLANQESRKYRNRLIWFQRIAAGVLLLLLGSGAWLWMSRQTTESQLTHGTDQARATGSEMARAEGGTTTLPADATSPSTQTASDPAEKGTSASRGEAQQDPRAGTSPEALAKRGPATTGPLADKAGESAVGLSTGPALAKEKRSGTPVPGAGPAKRSAQGRTGNPEAYLARGGRNGKSGLDKSGLNDAGETASQQRTARTPAKALVAEAPLAEAPLAGEVPATGATNSRLAVARITAKTLLAKEPVIRPRSILPLLNEAYWAKVVTEEEKVAQQADAKRDRWQLGLAFTPGAFQPNFRVNEGSPAYNSMNQFAALSARTNADPLSAANRDLETATAQGLSYQTGLRLEYALSQRLSIQSGVDYQYNSSSVDTYSLVRNSASGRNEPAFATIINYENKARAESIMASDAPPSGDYNSSLYDVNPNTLSQAQSVIPVRNVYQYVAIPVRVNYRLFDTKLGATLGAGVSGDVFLSNRFGNEEGNEERQVHEVRITSTKGTAYRKLGFSAWLGLKMHYRFARKYSVFLEPSYRTAVTSYTNTPALQSRPSMFGVGTGLQMLF
ncbi:MAG: hypothetical protein ICV83_24990 [Cytophagales bacterium]|nr:hypothetical protein [Cytophagales bacterium]